MQAWRDLRTLPRAMWVLFAATLVNRAGTMALPFLVLYLTRHLDYSPTEAGAVMGVYGAVALVAGPLAGRLADRVGSFRVMCLSLLLGGALQACVPLARHPLAVTAVVAAWAAAAEMLRPAALAAVAETVAPSQHRQAYAVLRLAVNLGMSLGPALGGWLATTSFPALFWVDGGTAVLAAGVLLSSGLGGATRGPAASRPATPGGDRNALADPRLRWFLVGVIGVALVFFQGESSMPIFLVSDLGFSTAEYGLLFVVNTGMIVLLEIPLTSAIAGWEPRRALALGALLTALGFGGLALARTGWAVVLTVVVWTMGEMVFSPASTAYVAEAAPPSRRGESMGLFTAAYSLALVVAPPAGTASLQALGGATHWLAVGLMGVLAAGLFLALPPGTARAEDAGTGEDAARTGSGA